MADLCFVGHEAYTILGAHCKKIKQNYEYKIKYGREYLFRMRKEITTNFKFKNSEKNHKHHNIQKNNTIVLLITRNCLKHQCNIFPTFFDCTFFDSLYI
jgi:ATP-dependent RNA circularization protein (DNA/RNA ligase family)